jgi:hypothetical protein
LIFLLILFPARGYSKEGLRVTNEMIYEKLIEIEKRQAIFEEQFKQMDRRFEELREDMNKRFEHVDM